MDLGTLRYFEAVVRCGSISAAGRALGLSQPTISNAIQSLERELGTRLLNRTRTGVTLTVTGHELYARAHELLSLHDETVERIRELEGGETGEFVVAVAEELATWLAPILLQTVIPALPGVALTVRVARGAEVARAVQEREAHFAFLVEPERLPDLVLVTLGRDRAGLYASEVLARHRGLGRSGSQPSQSERVGWTAAAATSGLVAYADHDPFALRWLEVATRAGLRPTRSLTLGSTDVVRRVVGLGVAFGLLPAGQSSLHAGLVELPVDLEPASVPLGIVFRADVHRTRAAVRLKDQLIALGRQACGSAVA